MAEPTKKHLTVTQRLERLGLAHRETDLKKLNVKGGATVRISSTDKQHEKHIAILQVKSAKDLKRWMGVPEDAGALLVPAVGHPGRMEPAGSRLSFPPSPSIPMKNKEMQANLMAYLLSTNTKNAPTTSEKKLHSLLDEAVKETGMAVSVWLAADIHVEEGATLIVDNSIQTLFGNHIILENNAKIIMMSSVARIDCARIRFVQS